MGGILPTDPPMNWFWQVFHEDLKTSKGSSRVNKVWENLPLRELSFILWLLIQWLINRTANTIPCVRSTSVEWTLWKTFVDRVWLNPQTIFNIHNHPSFLDTKWSLTTDKSFKIIFSISENLSLQTRVSKKFYQYIQSSSNILVLLKGQIKKKVP